MIIIWQCNAASWKACLSSRVVSKTALLQRCWGSKYHHCLLYGSFSSLPSPGNSPRECDEVRREENGFTSSLMPHTHKRLFAFYVLKGKKALKNCHIYTSRFSRLFHCHSNQCIAFNLVSSTLNLISNSTTFLETFVKCSAP